MHLCFLGWWGAICTGSDVWAPYQCTWPHYGCILLALFAPPMPAARVAVPALGWLSATALEQTSHKPVGCLGAILQCQFGAKGPHNSSGFGLLYLFYRESPAAAQHKVTFTVGRRLLKRTRASSNSALWVWHWTNKIDPQHLSMSPCPQGFVVVLFSFHITENIQQILLRNLIWAFWICNVKWNW